MAGVLEEMEVDDKITPLATSTEARSGGEAGGGGETDESRKEDVSMLTGGDKSSVGEEEGGGREREGGREGGATTKSGKTLRKRKRLRNEPQNVVGQNLPIALNIQDFAEARATELFHMSKALEGKGGGSGDGGGAGKRVFQQLPRHMRRRAMSHNVRRLPRRLREKAKKEMDQKTGTNATRSRKARRKTRNLHDEYSRRQRKNAWLETHIWHAKRMHMIDYYSYRVAHRPNDKGLRQAYLSMKYGCLLMDISFFCCVEVTGTREDIIRCLSPHFPTDTGLTIGSKAYSSGAREGHAIMYHANQYPYKAIGPVQFLWQPQIETNNTTDQLITLSGSSVQLCQTSSQSQHIRCKEFHKPDTRLWVVCSPAMYEEAMAALSSSITQSCHQNDSSRPIAAEKGMEPEQCAMKLGQGKVKPIQGLVTLRSLKDELTRFRLTGPRSHALVMETLKPIFTQDSPKQYPSDGKSTPHSVTKKKARTNSTKGKSTEPYVDHLCSSPNLAELPKVVPWWDGDTTLEAHDRALKSCYESLRAAPSTSDISRGMVLGMVVQDPRLFTPSKKTDMVSKFYPKKKSKRRVVEFRGKEWEVEEMEEEEEEEMEVDVEEEEEDAEEKTEEEDKEQEEDKEKEEWEDVEEEKEDEEKNEVEKNKDNRIELVATEAKLEGSNECIKFDTWNIREEEMAGKKKSAPVCIQNPFPGNSHHPASDAIVGVRGDKVGWDESPRSPGGSVTTTAAVGNITMHPLLAYSPIWSSRVRETVKTSRLPHYVLNKLRSTEIPKSPSLDLGPKSPRIPVLLIHQCSSIPPSGVLNSGHTPGSYTKFTQHVTTSQTFGWDLVLPNNWAMAFWVSLIYRGARACSLSDQQKWLLESGALSFPHDFPDTSDGRALEEEQCKAREEKYLRYPPDKRRNYGKLLIPHPFLRPWRSLIQQWREVGRRNMVLLEGRRVVHGRPRAGNRVGAGNRNVGSTGSDESGFEEENDDEEEEDNEELFTPKAKRPKVAVAVDGQLENIKGVSNLEAEHLELQLPKRPCDKEKSAIMTSNASIHSDGVHDDWYVLRSKSALMCLAHFLQVLFSIQQKHSQEPTYRKQNNLPILPISESPSFKSLLQEHCINQLLVDHCNSLVPVCFEMLHRGSIQEQAIISLPTSSDLRYLESGSHYQGPDEVLSPRGLTVVEGDMICVGLSGLTRKETHEMRSRRKRELRERRAEEKERSVKKLTSTQVFSCIKKDFDLKPAIPSRQTIGYVTSAGYRLCSSKSGGIGLCTLPGLLEAVKMCYSSCRVQVEEKGIRGNKGGGGGGGGGRGRRGRRGGVCGGGGGAERGGGGGKGDGKGVVGGLLVLVRGETIQYRFAKCDILL